MTLLFNQKAAFVHMLAESFAVYAEKYPYQCAMILEKMLFPESGDYPEEPDAVPERINKVVSLLLVLPEKTAGEILGEFRCMSNEENENVDDSFLDQFIFEMARIEGFDPYLFSDALSEFAFMETAEPFGGIDRTRIIGEEAFGTKRMIDCINRLTDMLTASGSEPEEDAGTH
ncbi:MAG: hypothetical protein ACRCUT_04345 [Spirochaetota bacterium]